MTARALFWPPIRCLLRLATCATIGMASGGASGAAPGAAPDAALVSGSDRPLGREQAVRAARAGRHTEAIAALQALADTGDVWALHDLVVVLGWAGRPGDAAVAYARIRPAGSAPDYVQRAVAHAYRGLGRFAEAEALLAALLRAQPDDAPAQRLLAGVWTDQGRARDAMALLERVLTTRPGDADHWIALGNAALALPDPFTALRAFGQARRLQPAHAEAAAAAARVLQGLGAPFGAARQLPVVPIDLRIAQAGRRVRWASLIEPPKAPAARHAAIDAALLDIERLLAELAATPGADPGLRQRLRFDQVVALRQRERWAASLAAAQALRVDAALLPPYVRQAEADALLALRHPEEALAAYHEVLAADPGNRDARIGRFYAEVETEDFTAALATADAMVAHETGFQRFGIEPAPRPNPDWLDAHLLAAHARSYADMPADAWARLQPLADGAPALADLRAARADIATGRGWPRLADEEIHIAASLSPDSRGIRLGLADAAVRRGRWAEARQRLAALAVDWPDDSGVQRSLRDLRARDGASLDAGLRLRRESGSAQAAPGNGIDAHLHLASAPIGDTWRALAATERQTATPIEGPVLRLRQGLGLQYQGADVQAGLMAWHNAGELHRGGVSASAGWSLSDHAWLGAEAESFARDTPLRALRYGITARSLGASARYAWHESRTISASVQGLDFSDGNRRRSVSLAGAERLVAQPHFWLDLRPALQVSRNSSQQGPYFSPLQDRALHLGLEAEQVLWRRYDATWLHRLTVSAGSYWQQGFGADAVGSVGYQQVWRNDPWTEWRIGLDLGRSVYDGVPENSGTLFVNVLHRF